jgi:hypothetical protein
MYTRTKTISTRVGDIIKLLLPEFEFHYKSMKLDHEKFLVFFYSSANMLVLVEFK